MELILTEWIGAGSDYVQLCDDKIIALNIAFLKNDKDLKKYLKKKIDFIPDTVISEQHLKDYYSNFFSNKAISDKIIAELDKINKLHKKNLKPDCNPICELLEIRGEIYVRTYQFAAEFEIPYGVKKEEVLKIKIEPRNLISETNFKRMFEVVFNFHQLSNISGGQTNSFMLLYYLAFLGRLSEVLRKGVYREYIDLEDNLHFLIERLLITEHTKLNYFSKDKVYCAFSELSADNIINQTIQSTLNLMRKKYRDYPTLHHEIRKLQAGFIAENVSDNPVNLKALKNIRYNRQNKRYEEIVEYCANIINNIGGTFSSDNEMKYSSFYLDMNELFESYVGKRLIETSRKTNEDDTNNELSDFWEIIGDGKDYAVELQKTNRYYLDEEEVFEIRPDFLIKDSDGIVVAVADTKYKRLNDDKYKNYGISSSDVYQMISYAYKFNAKKMIIIYPKPPDNFDLANEKLSFTIGSEKTVHICFIDLFRTPPMPKTTYIIEEYIATIRKKNTIYMVFNRNYNDIRAFGVEMTDEVQDKFLKESETDWQARDDFLSYMQTNFPETKLVEVGDNVPLTYLVWPYLGSIAIDTDEGSDVYQALCKTYEDASGNAKSNNAVLWLMEYETAVQLWEKRNQSWDAI